MLETRAEVHMTIGSDWGEIEPIQTTLEQEGIVYEHKPRLRRGACYWEPVERDKPAGGYYMAGRQKDIPEYHGLRHENRFDNVCCRC